jgi:alpha-D-ribose 1-methylphosphonate 5-triphosphate synthase subunit PhnH
VKNPWETTAAQSQLVFRSVLSALARPGTSVEITSSASSVAAIVSALLDGETTHWLSPHFLLGPTAASVKLLLRQSGSNGVARRSADVAILGSSSELLNGQFLAGSDVDPHRSALVLVQVPALTGGVSVVLSGPGIEGVRTISPVGVSYVVWNHLATREKQFPVGFDVLLMTDSSILGLPRTTVIRPDREG